MLQCPGPGCSGHFIASESLLYAHMSNSDKVLPLVG
jgi:hypothetical protein